MKEYLQTFSDLDTAESHAIEFSKRKNRPELSAEDSADLFVIQTKDFFYVSNSSYAGIYDYVLGCFSEGKKIS